MGLSCRNRVHCGAFVLRPHHLKSSLLCIPERRQPEVGRIRSCFVVSDVVASCCPWPLEGRGRPWGTPSLGALWKNLLLLPFCTSLAKSSLSISYSRPKRRGKVNFSPSAQDSGNVWLFFLFIRQKSSQRRWWWQTFLWCHRKKWMHRKKQLWCMFSAGCPFSSKYYTMYNSNLLLKVGWGEGKAFFSSMGFRHVDLGVEMLPCRLCDGSNKTCWAPLSSSHLYVLLLWMLHSKCKSQFTAPNHVCTPASKP